VQGDPRSFEVAGMAFRVPETWERQAPQSAMRLGQFRMPGPEGVGDGELAVSQARGTLDANVKRWAEQFKSPPGQKPEQRTLEVAGHKITFVDIRGDYSVPPFMAAPGEPPVRLNYRMLGAVLDTGGPEFTFFKAVGPEKTMERHRDAFLEFLQSGRKPGS
jgi:hypothetical protein